jgi:hypothetical protein
MLPRLLVIVLQVDFGDVSFTPPEGDAPVLLTLMAYRFGTP